MDLLSLVGQVTKRKGDLFSQAETLARKAKSQSNLEKRMLSESRSLVEALRDRAIKWDEYYRTLVERSLVSALAATYLGASKGNPKEVMEKAWPIVIGDMLPPLHSFLYETEKYLENGALLLGDKTLDFADMNLDEADLNDEDSSYLWAQDQMPLPAGVSLAAPDKPALKKKPTWPGIYARVKRYLATPSYSFSVLGDHLVKLNQGFTLMKRVAVQDSRTCPDCLKYERMGWQPVGSLPMPGRQCRCYDRCRCRIEYR